MFENIIRQDHVVSLLSRDINEGTLPSSLLFYGNDYTGKLSAALELARILSCERGTALWDCPCKACEMQRLLIHPDTLMMGSRYFAEEIAASASALSRTRQRPAQYLFVRSVRKLTRRFDPAFTEAQDTRFKRAQGDLAFLEDAVNEFLPGIELPAQGILEKRLGEVVQRASRIDEGMRGDAIQIDPIRRMASWAHLRGSGRAKILILENADRMSEGAKNALLKILEEPPAGLFIILLTAKREGIIPTILSRVRQYQFAQRSPADEELVIQKIFRGEPGCGEGQRGLRDYLFSFFQVDILAVRKDAQDFLRMLMARENFSPDELFAIMERERDDRFFKPFLEELSSSARSLLDEGGNSRSLNERITVLQAWLSLLSRTASERDMYNLNPSLLIEGLFYQMRDSL